MVAAKLQPAANLRSMPPATAHLNTRQARRLALARAGLLKPEWTSLPRRASGRGARARRAAHAVIGRFGYLQLDTIAVAGARSHSLVLLSRLSPFDTSLGEELLRPGEPLFEYWGHEASWLPLDLYPTFEFRRRDYAAHPWWGDVLGENPRLAEQLLRRIGDGGPLRTAELEGVNPRVDSWYPKVAKRVALAFWSRGDLAIRERRCFHRVFDLAERVIPAHLMDRPQSAPAALRTLLMRALDGWGWAQTGTLAATWRLRNRRREIATALAELESGGAIVPCSIEAANGRHYAGWVRPQDLELAARLERCRPRPDSGLLLSPFDPLLWDRARTLRLFGFEHIMEIFKPRSARKYGYYCMPVLAGDRLVARIDLKADRKAGRIAVRACHFEADAPTPADRRAVELALDRHTLGVRLELDP